MPPHVPHTYFTRSRNEGITTRRSKHTRSTVLQSPSHRRSRPRAARAMQRSETPSSRPRKTTTSATPLKPPKKHKKQEREAEDEPEENRGEDEEQDRISAVNAGELEPSSCEADHTGSIQEPLFLPAGETPDTSSSVRSPVIRKNTTPPTPQMEGEELHPEPGSGGSVTNDGANGGDERVCQPSWSSSRLSSAPPSTRPLKQSACLGVDGQTFSPPPENNSPPCSLGAGITSPTHTVIQRTSDAEKYFDSGSQEAAFEAAIVQIPTEYPSRTKQKASVPPSGQAQSNASCASIAHGRDSRWPSPPYPMESKSDLVPSSAQAEYNDASCAPNYNCPDSRCPSSPHPMECESALAPSSPSLPNEPERESTRSRSTTPPYSHTPSSLVRRITTLKKKEVDTLAILVFMPDCDLEPFFEAVPVRRGNTPRYRAIKRARLEAQATLGLVNLLIKARDEHENNPETPQSDSTSSSDGNIHPDQREHREVSFSPDADQPRRSPQTRLSKLRDITSYVLGGEGCTPTPFNNKRVTFELSPDSSDNE